MHHLLFSPCVLVTLLEILVEANHRPVPPRGEVCSVWQATIVLHKLQDELQRDSQFLHPLPFYNSIWPEFSLMIWEIELGLVQVSKFCYFQSQFQFLLNYYFSLHFAWFGMTANIPDTYRAMPMIYGRMTCDSCRDICARDAWTSQASPCDLRAISRHIL